MTLRTSWVTRPPASSCRWPVRRAARGARGHARAVRRPMAPPSAGSGRRRMPGCPSALSLMGYALAGAWRVTGSKRRSGPKIRSNTRARRMIRRSRAEVSTPHHAGAEQATIYRSNRHALTDDPRTGPRHEHERHYERAPDPAESSDRPLEPKSPPHELSESDEPGSDHRPGRPRSPSPTEHPVGEPDPTADSDPYRKPTSPRMRPTGRRELGRGPGLGAVAPPSVAPLASRPPATLASPHQRRRDCGKRGVGQRY